MFIIRFLSEILGGFLSFSFQAAPSWLVSVLATALAVKLLTLPVSKRYYNTLRTADALKERLSKREKKNTGNAETTDEAKVRLFLENKYPLFGNLGTFFAQGIFSIGVHGAFSNPETYLTVSASSDGGMLRLRDLSRTMFGLFTETGVERTIALFALFTLLLLTLVVIHDKLMAPSELIERKAVQIPIGILLLAGCVFFNLGFILYWLFVELMNIAHILLIVRAKARPQKKG